MPKKVEKWEADSGGFYDTELQALDADYRNTARIVYEKLAETKLGSYTLIAASFDLLWKNRQKLLPLMKAGIE
jgi:hypothetical protein